MSPYGYGAQGCGAYPFLLSDAYQHFLLAPSANPFAYRWIPIATPYGSSRAGVGFISYVDAPRSIARQVGAQIHPGDNPEDERVRIDPSVHHISIAVAGELAVSADQVTDDLATFVRSNGNRASMLKGRITLAMANARQRVFDFDIGAGVEFSVWCQSVQKIEALIPDPDFPPVVPDSIPDLQLATVLTTSCYRCQAPTYRMPLTYSIALQITSAPNDEAFVPVVAEARDVAVYVDEANPAAGAVTVEFVYVFGLITEVTYGPLADPFISLGQVTLPANATHIPATLIPGQANAMRVTRTLGSDDTTVNIVQVLNT